MEDFYALPEYEYHKNDSVFLDALEVGRQLDGVTFGSFQEACNEGTARLQEVNRRLIEEKLSGEQVTMHGIGISVPTVEREITSGKESIISESVTTNFNDPSQKSGIDGTLQGFIAYIKRDEISGLFMAEVHTQIAMKDDVFLDNFVGRLCAHGNIESTSLEFQHDTCLELYRGALISMIDATHDEQTAKAVHRIRAILEPRYDYQLFDANKIRALGKLVRTLEAEVGDRNEKFREAVTDGVVARYGIDHSSEFALSAMSAALKQSSQSELSLHTRFRSERSALTRPIFTPYYTVYSRKMKLVDGAETLALAIEVDKDTLSGQLHVPFEKITSLRPA